MSLRVVGFKKKKDLYILMIQPSDLDVGMGLTESWGESRHWDNKNYE